MIISIDIDKRDFTKFQKRDNIAAYKNWPLGLFRCRLVRMYLNPRMELHISWSRDKHKILIFFIKSEILYRLTLSARHEVNIF